MVKKQTPRPNVDGMKPIAQSMPQVDFDDKLPEDAPF
jgi:hypothetical protein